MARRSVRAILGVMGIILRYVGFALSGLSCEVFVRAEGDVLMDG